MAMYHRLSMLPRVFAASVQRIVTTAADEVTLEIKNKKGIITLNRPNALNALNLSMIRQIYPTLQKWERDLSIVIIKGTGGKAFCAGGDVVSITDAGKKGDPDGITKSFFKEEYSLNNLIGTLRIPYIALLNGITMGGGVGLSIHGQFRVATEKTVFAMPETGIGLFPDVGGSYFLPRLGGKLGLYIALTGYRLKGKDVMLAGLATHLCDSAKIPDLEQELLDVDVSIPHKVETVLKKYTEQATFDTKKEFSLAPVIGKINKCFAAGTLEEIYSSLEKDGSEWALKTLGTLKKMSPTSMKVTIKQLEEGALKDLQECLQMEYRLVQRFCADHDFYEGVRAVLIDKDNNPKWKPSTAESVTPKKVAAYFAPLPEEDELIF